MISKKVKKKKKKKKEERLRLVENGQKSYCCIPGFDGSVGGSLGIRKHLSFVLNFLGHHYFQTL